MAMKEITIQPNETRAIKNVAEELKIFEGISHKYLVKYYGVEIHRVSSSIQKGFHFRLETHLLSVAYMCRKNCSFSWNCAQKEHWRI